jgi:hypothetical protein
MESAGILAQCVGEGALDAYPQRVRAHFRGRDLAHWRLRSRWDGVRDLRLFAHLVQALDGVPFEALDRDPWTAARALLRRPGLALRFAAERPYARARWAR